MLTSSPGCSTSLPALHRDPGLSIDPLRTSAAFILIQETLGELESGLEFLYRRNLGQESGKKETLGKNVLKLLTQQGHCFSSRVKTGAFALMPRLQSKRPFFVYAVCFQGSCLGG